MTRARDLGDFIADGGAPELVVDTTTLVVDSTNNRVGVGTATPSAALDVTGDVSIADKIIHAGDTNTMIRFPVADTILFQTSATERFRIASSGQLGVGGANYGTAGQLLTSGGNSAAPTWSDAPTSGASTGFVYFMRG
mgnify:CR=1 FL=1